MLLIFCPDPRHRLRPPALVLGIFKFQAANVRKKKKGKKQERNVEKRSKTNTHRTRSGRRSFEDLSRSLSLSLLPQGNHRYGQARTIEHKQHPKPNRNRNRNRNSTKTRASLCHLALLCTLFKYLRSFTIFMTAKNITTPTLARRRRRCW